MLKDRRKPAGIPETPPDTVTDVSPDSLGNFMSRRMKVG